MIEPGAVWGITAATLATILSWGLMIWVRSRQRRQPGDSPEKQVTVLGTPSPMLTWLKYRRRLPPREPVHFRIPIKSLPTTKGFKSGKQLIELALIVAWAAWVGRAYLNLSPELWPMGREFPSSIQTHYLWQLLTRCGDCALWNGFSRGGAPALADIHSSLLHPLVAITTLLLGVINGAKIALVASLAMAGIAQWWLARVIGLGWAARLWSAGIAVAGGHLTARMELGAFGVVLSAAACSLVLAPALDLALTGRRRSAVLLGITLALAMVAGQGYMQIGLIIGLLPPLGIFLVGIGNPTAKRARRGFALAAVLALLLAGIFWVPVAHFWPNISKNVDSLFRSAQPLKYLPLNLIVQELHFALPEILTKYSYPHLYANYVGLIPVLLALLGIPWALRARPRLFLSLLLGIVLTYLAAGAVTLEWLISFLPIVAFVRHPSQIATLAVPPLLALAAWGLDELLRWDLPRLALVPSGRVGAKPLAIIPLMGIFALYPLLFSLKSVYDFSQLWLVTLPVDDNWYQLVEAMETQTSQWIQPPFGEHFWLPLAIESDLKLSDGFRTWDWKEHLPPPPLLEASRDPGARLDSAYQETVYGTHLMHHAGNQYALVDIGLEQIPCQGVATGGHIEVDCQTDRPGILIVRENQWIGWQAWIDGTPIALREGTWLELLAPAGEHHYKFRYRPWDFVLGLLLSLAGLTLAAVTWKRGGS